MQSHNNHATRIACCSQQPAVSKKVDNSLSPAATSHQLFLPVFVALLFVPPLRLRSPPLCCCLSH